MTTLCHSGDWAEAATHYRLAINHEGERAPSSAVLYANRSAAYLLKGRKEGRVGGGFGRDGSVLCGNTLWGAPDRCTIVTTLGRSLSAGAEV